MSAIYQVSRGTLIGTLSERSWNAHGTLEFYLIDFCP
nr:MAG TPA_asm: hypothetical protein [Caudoviricetes sp.]